LRKFFLSIVIVGACAIPAGPALAASSEVTLQMDDGVSLAGTLFLPNGTPPVGGWPAVMLFHGLGATRAGVAPIAEGFLVNQGYAVLAYDARGHGSSGGLVTLDGPREMADLRTAFATLWGGSTLKEWRGRGIYKALVAYRARLAVARGYSHLEVDASDDSRPILQRLGFVPVTTTTPYVFTPVAVKITAWRSSGHVVVGKPDKLPSAAPPNRDLAP